MLNPILKIFTRQQFINISNNEDRDSQLEKMLILEIKIRDK